jgi:hypothetical protein
LNPLRLFRSRNKRNYSECPIIPREKRKPVESLDSSGF